MIENNFSYNLTVIEHCVRTAMRENKMQFESISARKPVMQGPKSYFEYELRFIYKNRYTTTTMKVNLTSLHLAPVAFAQFLANSVAKLKKEIDIKTICKEDINE